MNWAVVYFWCYFLSLGAGLFVFRSLGEIPAAIFFLVWLITGFLLLILNGNDYGDMKGGPN